MESPACDLCGSEEDAPHLTVCAEGKVWKIVRCPRCGLLYLSPRPGGEELGRYYGREYFFDERTESPRRRKRVLRYERSKHKFLGALAAGEPKQKVLDVGCMRGEFLGLFDKQKWELYGVEPSREAASYAKETAGAEVFCGELEEAGFPSDFFDLVTLWHVLEHAASPSALLSEVRRVLRPSGTVAVAVPNAASLQARIFRERWSAWDPPRHLHHMDVRTLKGFLTKAGFEVAKMSCSEPDTGAHCLTKTLAQITGRDMKDRRLHVLLAWEAVYQFGRLTDVALAPFGLSTVIRALAVRTNR